MNRAIGQIIPDSPARLTATPKFRAAMRALHHSIRQRRADELASASPFRRLIIRFEIAAEFRRERARLQRSRQAV
jgi:hypothetical protein